MALAGGMDVSSTEPHQVKSIETGTASLQLRLEMIARAEKTIDIEFYEFDTGDAPRLIVDALLRKKAQIPAIEVRLLIDHYSPGNLDAYTCSALIQTGILVRFYNPAFILNVPKVVHRNHRKHIIIDGKEVVGGGRNMADGYYDLKADHNYLDRDIWVRGPIVEKVVESFNSFWDSRRVKEPRPPRRPSETITIGPRNTRVRNTHALRTHEERLRRADHFASVLDPSVSADQRLLGLREDVKRVGRRLLSDEPEFEVDSISFIGDGPDWKNPDHRVTGARYYEILTAAKESLGIETPFFYLQAREKEVFRALKERGVDIDLLLNSHESSNEFAINHICLLQGLKFSRLGFDLFLFRGTWMSPETLARPEVANSSLWMQHSKTMVRDSSLTWIGSMNMDPRSIQRLNAESAFLIDDPAFNRAVREHMQKRFSASDEITNGRRTSDGSNPAKLRGGFLKFLKELKTLPYYLFEKQI